MVSQDTYEIIVYWSDEDNVFVAEVPELPGCAAHGTTEELALANAQDAIILWVKTAKEFGDSSPELAQGALKRAFESVGSDYVDVAELPAMLYHYCPEDAFPKILASGKLWASDVLRMPDRGEIAYAFNEIIAPVLGQCEDGRPKYFVKSVGPPDLVRLKWGRFQTHIACLSSTAEEPRQWRNYAKCMGYAIGFDRAALDAWCLSQNVSLFPMSYDCSRHIGMITRFLDKVKEIELNLHPVGLNESPLRQAAKVYLTALAMTMKRTEFREEHEWRVLVVEPEGRARFARWTRENGVSCFELPICATGLVKEIVLGPQCRADAEEVRRRLGEAGLDAVNIRRTGCHCDLGA